jgi:hypothetical protein
MNAISINPGIIKLLGVLVALGTVAGFILFLINHL